MRLIILLLVLAFSYCNFLKNKFVCRELFEDCDVNYPLDCCGGLMCRSKDDINLQRNPAKCYSK